MKEITVEILEKNGFKKFIAGQYILPNLAMHKNQYVNIAPMTELISSDGKVWLLSIKNAYTDAKIAITKGKIRSYKHIKNGIVVCDFIAVRKNGVGYLYDRENKVLVGSSTSTGFTYGDDVTT